MKKILSLLLTLSLLLSMGLAATAATSGQLVDGDNEIELPWDTREPVVYTYTATQTGTLYIATVDFYSAIGDYNYSDNNNNMYEWKDCTEFTVNGQLLEGFHYGSVEVVEGQTYTFSWKHRADIASESWYKLGFMAIVNLSYTDELIIKPGSKEMPVELYPEDFPTDSIEIPAGGSVWYALYYLYDAELLVTGENAYVNATISDIENMGSESVHLEAVDGMITMPLGSGWRVLVEIGNAGTEPAVFRLDYQYPLGSDKNPDELIMGNNTVTVKRGDYEGYYYEWTAQCDGVLTLTMPEKNWTAIVYNMTAADDGVWYDAPGENVIHIEAKKGEVFWISINNFNEWTEVFVGGEISFFAAVEYAHEYVDGVCEHCGDKEALYELGDVTGDGRVNARDARALLRYLAGLSTADELFLDAADFTGDGKINARDARAILRFIAGLT